jgi:hypothetical protein
VPVVASVADVGAPVLMSYGLPDVTQPVTRIATPSPYDDDENVSV